ncbi:MAG: LptF/LptG family permease [Paludibacteraceae bacterium]|nr:LptF/LptG family permease [Paludibacteraceae bacterium]
MFKILDRYIIRKSLGAYVLSLLMIIAIAIVIDITEKMDDFYANGLSFKTVVLEYYINFVPYYVNLFSPLFTFISIMFITSKLAFNSEIIAMLAGGISFKRLLVPYMEAAGLIALFTFFIGGYIIPPCNVKRLNFETKYVDYKPETTSLRNVQIKTADNEIAYMESYDFTDNKGYWFSIDRFDGQVLKYRLTARTVRYDSLNTWTVNDYLQREFVGMKEITTKGDELTVSVVMNPDEFVTAKNPHERLNNTDLKEFIDVQTERGRSGLNSFKLEYQKRYAGPFGSFILALIGVCVASKKVRGGTGFHMFIGLALSLVYILCTLLSSIFTVQAGWNPFFAIWTPNFVFLCVGVVLYFKAQK